MNRTRAELDIPPRTVIFSFDDGPNTNDDTTERLLDVLKKHQIQAMFCLLGENAEKRPDLVRRIYDEGHIIISHGYYDKHANTMNEEEFKDSLLRAEKAISAALAFDWNPKLYRPHGGFYKSLHEKIWKEEGYTLVSSNVRVYDAVLDSGDKNKVIRRAVKKLEKEEGGIFLLHDARGSWSNSERKLRRNPNGAFNRTWIPETAEEIINILLKKGFVFDYTAITRSAPGTQDTSSSLPSWQTVSPSQ